MSATGGSVGPVLPINGLYVAAHGSGPDRGLYRFLNDGGSWKGQVLAVVDGLVALAAHPSLPVIYGVSGAGAGVVHAWDISAEAPLEISNLPTEGEEPCHVAVSPSGRRLIVTNYESGSLAVWRLSDKGVPVGPAEVILLSGSSIDPERQRTSHPHQATFAEGLVYVVDLGADVVRVFKVSELGPAPSLTPLVEVATPANTGPRHLAVLPFGKVALTGELAGSVLTGRLDAHLKLRRESSSSWEVQLASRPTHQPKNLQRNYPGDIKSSSDGQFVYVAIRGRNTISSFAVDTDAPRFIEERSSSVRWPQHLLIVGDDLIVAGRDSSCVVAITHRKGFMSKPRTLFECPGAAWLLPIDAESQT